MSIDAAYHDRVDAALASFFGPLDDETITWLRQQLRPVRLARGEVLYRQGELGHAMHVVLTGRLEVLVHGADGATRILAHPRPGETVGEMALLTGERRSAEVRAMRDSGLAGLDYESFQALIARAPGAVQHLARRIVARISSSQRQGAAQARTGTIAVVPLHPTVDHGAFCRRLRLSMLRLRSVALVDSAVIRHRCPDERDEAARERFLDEAEERHGVVLLAADPAPTAWTRKCVGYADRILLVGDATADPSRTALEAELLSTARTADHDAPELALLHPAGHSPAGTSRWLASRRVARHHHVPLAGGSGFNRLARALADRAVGLVLAGGGARGFAHLGVIRALQEFGVPVDAVGGTSFGSVAATGPARGIPMERMLAEFREGFAGGGPLGDYTIPIVSLLHGNDLNRLLQRLFDVAIEDLWIPYFAVSSNLTRNRVEVHTHGSLWKAVRASVSLPGILPPVLEHGDLLVDGGVLDNLPVDVMREQVRGPIIAVDLGGEEEAPMPESVIPSSMEVLKSRLLPWRESVSAPTLASIIMKTSTLASRREVQFARAASHLYLDVPLARYDLMDFQHFPAIMDIGYRYACEQLERHLEQHPELVQRDPLFADAGYS